MVSTEEILPTVLDLLGVDVPNKVKAESLAPLLRGERRASAPIVLETMLPKNLFGWTPIEGIRAPELKYVESPNPELYDLGSDPGEKSNLAAERAAEARDFAARLSSHRSRAAVEAEVAVAGQLDETTRQRLAALGYAVTPERGGTLERSDPKDLVTLFDSLYGAYALMGAQRWEEASALLESVLRLHPRHVGAMVDLGEIHARRAFEGASVMSSSSQSSASGDNLLPVVLGENATRDFDSAAEWYRRALAVDPSSHRAHFGLGRVHARRGELDDAAKSYRRALEISPNDPDVQNEMAVILIRQGRMDEALERLVELVKAHPDHAASRRNLGALYRARGDRERALEEYRLAARLAPNDRVALFLLAKLLAEMNRLDEAVEGYRAVLLLAEDDTLSRIGLGDIYFRKGDRAAARREFETAVRLAPELAEAYFGLATLDAADGKLDDAERNYRLALRYQPGLLAAEVRLALLYRQQAKPDLAIAALRRAREIAPGNPQVEELMARLEAEKRSPDTSMPGD
jgi:tetratricopeptide (TPR) repeat protein